MNTFAQCDLMTIVSFNEAFDYCDAIIAKATCSAQSSFIFNHYL